MTFTYEVGADNLKSLSVLIHERSSSSKSADLFIIEVCSYPFLAVASAKPRNSSSEVFKKLRIPKSQSFSTIAR